ncbi:uncharacterized protein LOC142339705 isoform X2 [Convolutriloba macropyga]|uniref:uncharacterized protein LOC142339705 isoform X2 n=1 Tax=Convolutriloba macropyga TaxID=536237 RepID=UPI003F51FA4C
MGELLKNYPTPHPRQNKKNLEIRHSFNCIYEHKSVVSILLVYNVRDYFPNTRDYSDEKLYQRLGERLRVDLWPYGGCRDNIYVIFGYQPGFKECLEGTLCKHSQFHINVKLSKDGTQVETFRSRPSLPFAFETNMTTQFFKQTTREQRSAFFKGLRDFSKPLLETLKDFVEDVGKLNSSFGNDFISFKTETEFDFEFEWHFSGCFTSYQFLFQPIVCAVTRLLALEAY